MTLSTALRLNAVFSIATGLLLAATPSTVGSWLDVSLSGWLRVLGIALMGHAVLLIWASRQDSMRSWAKLNIAAIAPYPLSMIGLVATGLVDTGLGRAVVLLDGAIVGTLAFAQWAGLRGRIDDAHAVPA